MSPVPRLAVTAGDSSAAALGGLGEPAPNVAGPAQLRGNLDHVHPRGTVVGWCWSPADPGLRREVGIWIDGVEVARARCDQPRADLASAGIGDGAHGLALPLDARLVAGGCRASVMLRDVATGQQVGATHEVVWQARQGTAAAAAPAVRALAGSLDRVTREGWVSGWCWCPAAPDEHVELTVLVDGQAVGTTRATLARSDLKAAGIGDGSHGFCFALPCAVLIEKGMLRVTVRESASGTVIGDPVLIRAGRLATAEDRIQELEHEARLLRSTIDAMARQHEARDDERATRQLFATVAGFFQALAEGDAGTLLTGGLKAAVEDVTARFAPVALCVPEAPLATICVDAGASADCLYGCLLALHSSGVDAQADIVLIDDGGQGGEAALMPAIVRNLRYVRVRNGHIQGGRLPDLASRLAARNEVAATARGALVAYLAPQVRVMPGWLDEITATFARDPDAAAVGARVVRSDGRQHHTGILVGPDLTLSDPGWLATSGAAAHDVLRAMHALGDVAFALRRDRMAEAGGFATGFASPGHAVVDLCLRLRDQQWQVLYQPLAVAAWSDVDAAAPAPVPDTSLPDEDSRRLRERRLCVAAVPAVAHRLDRHDDCATDR